MAELNERDLRLVEWLQEAHAKESELEADLAVHISVTGKDAYRKQLERHLEQTRGHKESVAVRIADLGAATGGAVAGAIPTPVAAAAGKAVALVKGQLGAARAAMTEQTQTHIRNLTEEIREEHVEIALYTRIAAFAEAVGDGATARLARAIRREEERMATYLDGELVRQVKELVRTEIPRDQRAPTPRRRRSSSGRARTKPSSSGTASSRSRRTGSTSR